MKWAHGGRIPHHEPRLRLSEIHVARILQGKQITCSLHALHFSARMTRCRPSFASRWGGGALLRDFSPPSVADKQAKEANDSVSRAAPKHSSSCTQITIHACRKHERLKDFAWERYYDLSSAEIGELIRFPKMGDGLTVPLKRTLCTCSFNSMPFGS